MLALGKGPHPPSDVPTCPPYSAGVFGGGGSCRFLSLCVLPARHHATCRFRFTGPSTSRLQGTDSRVQRGPHRSATNRVVRPGFRNVVFVDRTLDRGLRLKLIHRDHQSVLTEASGRGAVAMSPVSCFGSGVPARPVAVPRKKRFQPTGIRRFGGGTGPAPPGGRGSAFGFGWFAVLHRSILRVIDLGNRREPSNGCGAGGKNVAFASYSASAFRVPFPWCDRTHARAARWRARLGFEAPFSSIIVPEG